MPEAWWRVPISTVTAGSPMFDLKVTVEGDKVLIDGLEKAAAGVPKAVTRGLSRVVKGIHSGAMDYLSGPGGAGKAQGRKPEEGERTGFKNKTTGKRVKFDLLEGAGAYPVPVRRGNLRRLLDFVEPGESKGSFSAAPDEAVVYDSAGYASVILAGTGSSAKYGPRDYLTDGYERFDEGNRVVKTLEEEIAKEMPA